MVRFPQRLVGPGLVGGLCAGRGRFGFGAAGGWGVGSGGSGRRWCDGWVGVGRGRLHGRSNGVRDWGRVGRLGLVGEQNWVGEVRLVISR